jgi:hypothetical protein
MNQIGTPQDRELNSLSIILAGCLGSQDDHYKRLSGDSSI